MGPELNLSVPLTDRRVLSAELPIRALSAIRDQSRTRAQDHASIGVGRCYAGRRLSVPAPLTGFDPRRARRRSRMTRDDGPVRRSPSTCGVCRRSRACGSHHETLDLFICDDCQADAKKLFEIQDSIWPDAGRSTDESEKQPQS
jgi:hypothetical protein